jgi:sterol desaturase/sphingolipid hydroxylase (fatty acid hydroxylase superfamily)
MRGVLTAALFPALTFGPVWLGFVGVRAGIDHRLIIVATVGGALLVQLALEQTIPYRRDWRARRRFGPDLAWLGLAALTGAAVDLLGVAGVYEAAARLSLDAGPWPRGWHLAAQLALAVVVADLGHYWAHRALHDVPWLWRFHRVHHAPDHLHALNFFRMHPVEITLKTLANVTPLILLGAPREVLALWSIVSGVSAGSVNHANVVMPTRWFDGWWSTPALHRHHHGRGAAPSPNLGNVTMIWDRVFGTHRRPRGDVEVGT